ncbi:MAG TPA: hypothetical protein VGS21_07380 [Acidimicrobiales bacterium]|nr:hypothetical protein [Acidimicrobiales bacterium]
MKAISPGRAVTVERVLSAADIEAFGQLSGDYGRHHLAGGDQAPIAHGLLVAAVVTKLGGDVSFLVRKMELEFVKPVVAGSTVRGVLAVEEYSATRSGWWVRFAGGVETGGEMAMRMEAEGYLARELLDVEPVLPALMSSLGLAPGCSVADVVRGVADIPYGRAEVAWGASLPDAALRAGRGTCSSKHYLLAQVLREGWPDLAIEVRHRVYKLVPGDATRLFGDEAAGHVPVEGLVDVHTYLRVGGRVVDATFPVPSSWAEGDDMQLASGDGLDVAGGVFPAATKARLVRLHCDPAVREPFIAALAGTATAEHEPNASQ